MSTSEFPASPDITVNLPPRIVTTDRVRVGDIRPDALTPLRIHADGAIFYALVSRDYPVTGCDSVPLEVLSDGTPVRIGSREEMSESDAEPPEGWLWPILFQQDSPLPVSLDESPLKVDYSPES